MAISTTRWIRSPALWFLPIALLILWGGILSDIQRARINDQHYAESSIQFQSQTFAEFTRANIEHVNELLFDARNLWLDQNNHFSERLRQRQGLIADLAAQISIIDENGYLVFSNVLAQPDHRYLGAEAFFSSHLGKGIDQLFISQPYQDPISNRWVLQFSRPIYQGKQFKGVIVISVFPDSLTNAHQKISLSNNIVTTISKASGFVIARSTSSDQSYQLQIKDFPFDSPNGPNTGVYTRVDQPDPINRLFGYVRLPEFDLIVFASLPFDEVMAPYLEHRIEALLVGAVMSLFLIGIGILVLRNLKASERAEQTARASEAMLQASIEVTGEGFVIFDDQDRLVYLNDRYRNLYSHTAPAMKIGTRFEEIIRYGVERGQYAAAIGHEEEWIAQRLQAHSKSEDQVLQQLGDGTWLKIRERRTPEGYTVGFRIDITEQVEARRAAEQALQDLKQAEKVKTLFLSNISHELRTPLNGIVGMTEVLFHTELNPQQREILKYLKESSEKLRALLMNLLDFSELQTKTLGVEFAPFNPYEMLGALTSKFQTLATGKRLSLKAESQGYVPYSVIGDMARITQVLRQLIENAIKFTAVGEVEVTMFFSAATEEEKPKLGFTVRDTGQGISSDDQVIIFQPFTQKDGSSTREQGGTGIGLSLARGIVEKLGGQLTLKSIPGVGSTFTFNVQVTLPT